MNTFILQLLSLLTKAICVLLSAFVMQSYAEWPAYYSGPTQHDNPFGITTDTSGNVYIIAQSNNGSNWDFVTIKFDPNGNRLWIARYDDPTHTDDAAVALCVDHDGYVYVTGTTCCNTESWQDVITVKYDSQGQEVWNTRFSSPGQGWDEPAGITVDNSGNIYVAGSQELTDGTQDWLALKYDPDGRGVWTNYVRGMIPDESKPFGVGVDGSGAVIVAGYAQFDPWLEYSPVITVKYEADGILLWARTNVIADSGTALAVDAVGNAFVGTESNILKYAPDGRLLWNWLYTSNGEAESIAVDRAGNVIVRGSGYSPSSGYHIILVKLDPDGQELWTKRWETWNIGLDDTWATGFAVDSAGNVNVSGWGIHYSEDFGTYSTLVLGRFDPQGNLMTELDVGGGWPSNNPRGNLAVDLIGNAFVLGSGIIVSRVTPPFAPELSVTKAGENMLLSWPSWVINAEVEASADLANWVPLAYTPVVIGDKNFLTNAMSGDSRFYRLRTP